MAVGHLQVSRRSFFEHPLDETLADSFHQKKVCLLRDGVEDTPADNVTVGEQHDLREHVKREMF